MSSPRSRSQRKATRVEEDPVQPRNKRKKNTKEPRVYNVSVAVQLLSRVRLFVTPWTVAHQAPLSLGFSRREHWSGLPFPSTR